MSSRCGFRTIPFLSPFFIPMLYSFPVPSVQIIYASTSGHTEYVVGNIRASLEKGGVTCDTVIAEKATPEDLNKGDVLLLASGTWNTGSIEGQLNPHMHDLLKGRAKDVDLKGRPVLIVALGDDRYYYTCRANEHFRRYAMTHNGKIAEPALLVVNEPYGQEEKVEKWVAKILPMIKQ